MLCELPASHWDGSGRGSVRETLFNEKTRPGEWLSIVYHDKARLFFPKEKVEVILTGGVSSPHRN